MFTFPCSSIRAGQLACVVVLSLVMTTCGEKTSAEHPPLPEVLKLLPRETPKPRYGVPVPKRISGRVERKSDGGVTGAAGVSVTDGAAIEAIELDIDGRRRAGPRKGKILI